MRLALQEWGLGWFKVIIIQLLKHLYHKIEYGIHSDDAFPGTYEHHCDRHQKHPLSIKSHEIS